MASNKERIDELESGLGLVREEIHNLHVGMDDKFRGIEASLNRSLEESLNRMMEAITTMNSNREAGSSAPRGGGRQNNEPPRQFIPNQRTEYTNPMALTPNRVKLEFPKFNGGDPTEWMCKAKQYFMYHDMPLEQRVSFALYHLTEDANRWWQAKQKSIGRAINWETFELELWTRFGPIDGENFDEELCHIHQKGSLLDYQREFEKLQNQVEGWTEKALVGAFMGGLHSSISSGIRIFKPKTMLEIVNLARLRDDQLQKEKKWANPRGYTSNSNMMGSGVRSEQTRPPTMSEQQSPPPRRLSWEELKKKRSLGLCFSCDERYTPGHRCKQPQLFIMEGEEELAPVEDEDGINNRLPEITLHALIGWGSSTTIQLRANIHGRNVLALIDSGSTHNFINGKIIEVLSLNEVSVQPFEVGLASGSPLRCRRRFNGVSLKIGAAHFMVTIYLLPLVGFDLVLGVQWLQSLGPILCNWKAQSLKFTWEGQSHELHGLKVDTIKTTHYDDVAKEARQGETLLVICSSEEKTKLKPLSDEAIRVSSELPPLRETGEGLTLEDATWETLAQLHTSFPDFTENLEDKILLGDGSIDKLQEKATLK